MEAEAERRGVDCSTYAGAIAAERARKAQVVQSYNASIQRSQPAPTPQPQGPKMTRCEQFGVARATLSKVLHGHAAISPEMVLRLEGWLGVENGGRADVWLAQQAAYDLWKARTAGMPVVKRAPELIVA